MPTPTTSSPTNMVRDSGGLSVDALICGVKWGGSTGTGVYVTYSFPWTTSSLSYFAPYYSLDDEPRAGLAYGLSAIEQTAARNALQLWANVANITFSEVAETSSNVGDIRIAWTSLDGDAWGWSYLPGSEPCCGDVWISTHGPVDRDWSPGSYNFEILMHEFGHCLGLKHPFDDHPTLPYDEDSCQYTIMSYTDHPHNLFVRAMTNPDGSDHYDYLYVRPDTPMLYDVLAIQYLYGPNLTYRTGDDVYTFDPDTPFIRTLWDAGGTDTISVSNFSEGCLVDLGQGHFSSITIQSNTGLGTYDGTDNLAIAFGCTIENAVGGGGDDTLLGNDGNNCFTGGPGNDTLIGGPGTDVALLDGIISQYQISGSGGYGYVTGPEGEDGLQEMEYLRFGSTPYTTDVPLSDALTGNPLNLAGDITDLYVAYFNRAPEAEGFDFWFRSIYNGWGSLRDIAACFAESNEYQINYPGSLTNRGFVERIYENLFDREPDQGGWDFWTSGLDRGVTQRSDFIVDIIEGAYSPSSGPEDRTLIDNKHDVALYYTGQLVERPSEGWDNAIIDILNLVTGDGGAVVSAERVIDYAFDNPITLTGVVGNDALFDSLWV